MGNRQKTTDAGVLRVYGVLRYVLIPLVLAMMVFSAVQLIRTMIAYREGENAYREASEQYVRPSETVEPDVPAEATPEVLQSEFTANPNAAGVPEPVPGSAFPDGMNGSALPTDAQTTAGPEATPQRKRAPITVDFDSLRAANSECVGWIYIPETSISYPVMQTVNNSKYLDHLPSGETNSSGSIFMDFRNHADMSDLNTIIYGHRLNNGTMFAPILKFRTGSFFNAHRIGYYLTPDMDYKLTFVACMTVSALGDSYEMYEDAAALRTYLTEVTKKVHASAAFTAEEVDRIVTLSTCTGNLGTRIILIAIPEPVS